MNLADYFALKSGNQAALVRALGLPQTTVAHWASRSRSVPAEYCVSIERATSGAVTRQDLLPSTWAAIWPELATGAPANTATRATDIHGSRRARLKLLIDQRTAGNVAAFSELFGYSRSRVSQFLSETYNDGRSIGERAARAMEEAADLPCGWLDQDSDVCDTATSTDDEPLTLILAELRKHTTLLEVLAKQGDLSVAARSTACADLCSVIRPATGAAASGLPG